MFYFCEFGFFRNPHISENIQYLSLSDTSASIMPKRTCAALNVCMRREESGTDPFIFDMSISEGGSGMAQGMEAWGLDSGEGRTFLDT